MRLAAKRNQIKAETNGIIGHESAGRAETIHPLHEDAHEEKAAEASRQDAQEPLKLVIDISNVGISEPKCHRPAQNSHDNRRHL